MSTIAVASLFVIAGLYLRRRYGAAALAALTIATAAVMSAVGAGGFLALVHGLGSNASNVANATVIAIMAMMQYASFGCAAIAIQVLRKDEGPWLTAPAFLFGLLGWVAGGLLAFGVVAVLGAMR